MISNVPIFLRGPFSVWSAPGSAPILALVDRRPGWMVDNRTSVEREAAAYRSMSREERLRLTALACRGAARQLAARADRVRLLGPRDPLPASSVTALARLREAFRRTRS